MPPPATKTPRALKHWITTNPLVSALIAVVVGFALTVVYTNYSQNKQQTSKASSPLETAIAQKVKSAPSGRGFSATVKQYHIETENGYIIQKSDTLLASITYTPQVSDVKINSTDAPKTKMLKQLNNHANTLARNGHGKEAATEYRFIIGLQPDEPKFHNNYGVLLFKQGSFDRAEDEFKEALKLDPTNPICNLNYYESKLQSGLIVAPFNRVLGTQPGSRPALEGSFIVYDPIKGPIYNVTEADYLVGGLPPTGYARSDHWHGVTFILLPTTLNNYISPLGILMSSNPSKMPEIDVSLSYSITPAGPEETEVFPFVSRQDVRGNWGWYAKL